MYKLVDNKGITFYINEIGTNIKVSLNKKKDSCVYACYFYFEDNIVKYHYQNSTDFSHQISLESFKVIKVRYFVWNKKNNLRTSETINITEQLSLFRTYLYFLDDIKNESLLNKDMRRYISDVENVEKGKILFEENKLTLSSFPAVEWKDWEADPFDNRSWQWALHWFDFSKHLLAFYHQTNDKEVLSKLEELITSWIKNYLYNDDIDFEFVWHDHATALRAKQILMLLYYLKENNKPWMFAHLSFTLSLFETLNVLGEKLEQESFYSKHTNHGLEQVRVLMLLGFILNNNEWVNISTIRLNDELSFSFTNEGVHKENSPGYHQFVFKIFLSIIEGFPDYVLKELSSNFKDIAPKALEYITYIIRPDNNLPIIGDTELKPTSDAYSKFFSGTIEYENFLYSLTQGKRGKVPIKNNVVYAKSGYAIFRNTWGSEKNFTDSMHLIFKAGCLSKYHHQQDENNFVLFAFGEDWLIDSGLYNYINKDPIRNYIRRRQAHNIPIISNTSYDHKNFNHRVENWSILDYCEDNNNPYVIAENTVLKNVKHKRSIEFSDSKLMIKENINCLDNEKRNVTFLLHVPIDKKIEVTNENILISSNKQNKKLSLSLSSNPDNIQIIKGMNKNGVSSIVSMTVNKYKESQVIKLSFKEIISLDFILLMTFY